MDWHRSLSKTNVFSDPIGPGQRIGCLHSTQDETPRKHPAISWEQEFCDGFGKCNGIPTTPPKTTIFSGQIIIATSHDLTPKGSQGREIPLFEGNLGWWNIISWPYYFLNQRYCFMWEMIQAFDVRWYDQKFGRLGLGIVLVWGSPRQVTYLILFLYFVCVYCCRTDFVWLFETWNLDVFFSGERWWMIDFGREVNDLLSWITQPET